MKTRTFNSIMPKVNEAWAAYVLGIDLNPSSDSDLISNSYIAEVKFRLISLDGRHHKTWKTRAHQLVTKTNIKE